MGEAVRQTLRVGLLRSPLGCGTASSLVVPCLFIPRDLCSCCLFSREYPPLSCVRAQSLQLCLTLCEPTHGLLCPLGSPGKNTGVGCLGPPPGDLPDPLIELAPLKTSALAGGFFTTGATWEVPPLFLGLDSMRFSDTVEASEP